ncbi:MAG: 4-hydroxybenzoate polyprenyltransferase [Candidatus Krumholzibacteriia bacterium]|jgi:4-hydroxybenzoate polyprenyltransferase
MNSQLRAAAVLTRPAQWPILTAQLAVGMVLAWPVGIINWSAVGFAWLAWVVMLNGGTLAFNSAYDKDTGPVAYLAAPPVPPSWLAVAALLLMNSGALLGYLLVADSFGLITSACVVLSVLYSHPSVRLKSKPGWDLAANIVGYGAGTTVAGISALSGQAPDHVGWWFVGGFGLLFGSFYPLTQIYQTEADLARGDATLCTVLGIRRSLVFAIILGALGSAAIWQGCVLGGKIGATSWPWLLLTSFSVWCLHLAWWWHKAKTMTSQQHEKYMYHALGIWAFIDVSLIAVWLLG